MNFQIESCYKAIYDFAVQTDRDFPEFHNALSIFPTHFARVNAPKKGLPMFIGRDPHGWNTNSGKIPYIHGYEFDQMNWLRKNGNYPYSGSPFLRVLGKVLANIRNETFDENVYHDYVWSDLFRICMREQTATPTKLKNLQSKLCANLLLNEIWDIQPSGIVFITGDEAYKITEFCRKEGFIVCDEQAKQPFKTIHSDCAFFTNKNGKKIPYIIVPHPQGKQEEPIINDIVTFFNLSKKII